MSKIISDDKLREYIRQIDSDSLADWIIAKCQDDNRLRSSLLNIAAPKEAVKDFSREIRSRITKTWAKARGSNGYRMALPISKELDLVLQSIETIIEKGCYVEAEKILVRYIQAAEKYGIHVDDSNGYLWPTCQAGITLWGKVCAKIESRDKIALAELVYSNIHNNINGLKDEIIPDFKEALGYEGLNWLKEKLFEEYKALPDSEKYTLTWSLGDIADAMNDVDFFIEIYRINGKTSNEAIPIARRLYEAARYEEALAYIETADRFQFHGEPYSHTKLKSMILIALGRKNDALKILWDDFSKQLCSHILNDILELDANENIEQNRDKAYKIAMEHNDIYSAMYFLTEQGDFSSVAQLIEQRQDKISGSNYNFILPVAKKIYKTFPAQAWILLKALTVDILESNRYDAYGHAVNYFKMMDQLSIQAGIQAKQGEFIQYLKLKHGRKSSFWAKVDANIFATPKL